MYREPFSLPCHIYHTLALYSVQILLSYRHGSEEAFGTPYNNSPSNRLQPSIRSNNQVITPISIESIRTLTLNLSISACTNFYMQAGQNNPDF